MSQVYITNGQTGEALTHIRYRNILSNSHKKSLEDNSETFDFTTHADKTFSRFIDGMNRIIIPGEDDNFLEFIIYEVLEDRIKKELEIYSYASYAELITSRSIEPHTTEALSAEAHGNLALAGTEWQMGNVEFEGVRTITFENYTNPYAYLKRIASVFDLELDFRIEHDNGNIIGRYVDLVEKVGQWRGRRVEFGKDLIGLKRKVNTENIVTALRVIGPVRENGSRLEVIVEDLDALARWGRNKRHIIKEYEPQFEDIDNATIARLRELGEQELAKRVNAIVSYEGTIADLENVPGMENKKIRFGDTIQIKDTSYEPALYLDARIFFQGRDIKEQAEKVVYLGDFNEYTEEEVHSIWKELQQQIASKIGRLELEAYAEPVIPEQDTPPSNPKKGDKWVDTSENPPQLKLYDGSEWHAVKGEKGDRGEPGKDGYTPIKGVDYFDGKDGQDGSSSYLWVRYSQNANGNPMSPDPTNAKYIGVATTETPSAPTSPTAYVWSLIKGSDGIPGEDGEDGRTSYLHIKYSNDGGQTFTGNNGEDVGEWIGTYVDFTQADSNNVNDYTWNKVKGEKGDKGDQGPPGIQGPPGEDGQSQYVHIRYSANSNGNPMTTTPQSNSKYIGLANTNSPTAPSSYTAYTWSLIRGADGQDGIPGPKGDDGQTTYTWVRYADDENGSGMSDSPHDKLYIGLAFNKTTPTESNNAGDYTWSLMPQNIEIGGRNLLLNTEFKGDVGDRTPKGWGEFARNPVDIAEIIESPWGTSSLNAYHIKVSGGGRFNLTTEQNIPVQNGELITISLQADSDELEMWWRFLNEAGDIISYRPTDTFTKGSGKYYRTLEVPNDARYFNLMRIGIGSSTATTGVREVRFEGIQIEKGNKPSDWRRADEDIQAEIDEAKETAVLAQQSADGKNTVYRQSSTPPTTNRKTGDLWFKTNEGNKMFVWTGSWTETKLDYQALAVGKLSAISADLGDVTSGKMTAVEVEGVTGTFGKVSVVDGDFSLLDEITQTESIIRENNNMINDHSFEMIPTIGNGSANGVFAVDSSKLGSFFWWNCQTIDPSYAQVQSTYGTGDARRAKFGRQAAVLRNSSQAFWYQYIELNQDRGLDGPYTVSCYFSAFELTNSPTICEVVVQAYDWEFNWLGDFDRASVTVEPSEPYLWKRTFTTVRNLPNNTAFLRIRINTRGGFALADGVQFVPFSKPTVYEAEEGLWKALRGESGYEAQHFSTNTLNVSKDMLIGQGLISSDGDHVRIYPGIGVNHQVRIRKSDGQFAIQQNGSYRHIFQPDGNKTGGSFEYEDGTVLGMSPIDSPQILIEYIEFDIPLSPNGTKVYIDERYHQAIYKYAVFPNNGTVTEKNEDYFIVTGEGYADIRIVGERLGEEGTFWDDMKGYEEDDKSQIETSKSHKDS